MNRSLVGAAGAALVAGLATLALNAPHSANAQEEFRVTAQQLKINQRISQVAVRRANEALKRLDALVAPSLENDTVSVVTDGEVVPPGEARAAEAACGSRLIPGSVGYTLPETAVGLIYESRPLSGVGGGWRVAFRNDGTEPVTLTLTASCKP